jgi:hypothetical protein
MDLCKGQQPSVPGKYRILDSNFEVHAPHPGWLEYFDRFARSYDAPAGARDGTPPREIHVFHCEKSDLEGMAKGTASKVFHRSGNYTHWNIQGYGDGPEIALSQYGLYLRCEGDRSLEVHATMPRHPRAAELLFHAARNLALYDTDRSCQFPLHASSVVSRGHAVLFGGVKGAGKSTLFLEAVLNAGCKPFANDRVFWNAQAGNVLASWPSYLSCCEGTILDYQALREAYVAYERDPGTSGLRRWGEEFTRAYSQDRKRIIPPDYLTAALRTRYSRYASRATVVLPAMHLQAGSSFRILREGMADGLTDEELSQLVLSQEDEDIPRWHAGGRHSPGWKKLAFEGIRASKAAVFRIELNPEKGKIEFRNFLKEILS